MSSDLFITHNNKWIMTCWVLDFQNSEYTCQKRAVSASYRYRIYSYKPLLNLGKKDRAKILTSNILHALEYTRNCFRITLLPILISRDGQQVTCCKSGFHWISNSERRGLRCVIRQKLTVVCHRFETVIHAALIEIIIDVWYCFY